MPPSAHTLKLEAFALSTSTQVDPRTTLILILTVTLTPPQVDPQLLTHRLDALSERLGVWYSAQATLPTQSDPCTLPTPERGERSRAHAPLPLRAGATQTAPPDAAPAPAAASREEPKHSRSPTLQRLHSKRTSGVRFSSPNPNP